MLEDEYFFPGTQWHDIGDGIAWRSCKHWGMGVWAGEGLEFRGDDRSGCRRRINGDWWASPPCVVESRVYRRGDLEISAVFSYPGGIGIVQEYFWETMPYFAGASLADEIERFMGPESEKQMEAYIRERFARIVEADQARQVESQTAYDQRLIADRQESIQQRIGQMRQPKEE